MVIRNPSQELAHAGRAQDEDLIFSLAQRLDFINIQILRKFYMTGRPFPDDTQPHCFAVLYMEMKSGSRVKMGPEAFRKRLDKLVSMNLLKKVGRTNPANYFPVKGIEQTVRAVVARFMMNNGLSEGIF